MRITTGRIRRRASTAATNASSTQSSQTKTSFDGSGEETKDLGKKEENDCAEEAAVGA